MSGSATTVFSLFDTHCHLDFPQFDDSRGDILASCREVGVAQILVPGVRAADWDRVLELCRSHRGVYPALGMHPCFLSEHRPADDLIVLERLLADEPVVAVGEVGLDFWRGRGDESAQKALLGAQLQLAVQYRLPVLLHVRKAHDEVLALLRRHAPARGGIVHAFSGSEQQARSYWDLGFRLGVGGGVTYPRAQRLRRTLQALPVEALVLETDAPDMPLYGYQGQQNRPDRLPTVLAVLAELRQTEVSALAAQLWENSCAVFGLGVDEEERV